MEAHIQEMLQKRPSIDAIWERAKDLSLAQEREWSSLSEEEQSQFFDEAKQSLRYAFTQTSEYQALVSYYLTQEKDFIESFALRRHQRGVINCEHDDLVALAHSVLLEVLGGYWGYWDHNEGPFQNFFRVALFRRFLTHLSQAGVLKTSASKRKVAVDEVKGDVVVSTRRVFSLDQNIVNPKNDSVLSLSDVVKDRAQDYLDWELTFSNILDKYVPDKRDQKLIRLSLLGLPHTEKGHEERELEETGTYMLKDHVLPCIRALGVDCPDRACEPTVIELLGMTVPQFRYHKRRIARQLAKGFPEIRLKTKKKKKTHAPRHRK